MPMTTTRRRSRPPRRGGRAGISSPAFRGRGGTQAEGLGGEGLSGSEVKTLTSHPLRGRAPPLPRKAGEEMALAAAFLLLLAAAPAPARPQVMLMTGLPLVWGEK